MVLNEFSETMFLASQINALKRTAECLTEAVGYSIILGDYSSAELFQAARDSVVTERANKIEKYKKLYKNVKYNPAYLYSDFPDEDEDDEET